MQNTIVHNTFFRGLLTFFNIVLPVVVAPYLYRVFSPEILGSYEYAGTIFIYFNLFGVLGIYSFGLREASKIKNDIKKTNHLFNNLFYTGIISNTIVCLFFVPLIFVFIHDHSLKLFLLVYSINFVANIFNTEWLNEAHEKFKFIAIKTLIIRALFMAAIFIFVKTNADIYLYLWLTVLSNMLNYYIGFCYCMKTLHLSFQSFSVDWKIIAAWLPSLFFILLLNNSNVLYTLLDRFMLGTFVNKTEVAYYSISQKIIEITRSLLMILVFVSIPRLSHLFSSNISEYKKILDKTFKLIMLLTFPVAVILFFLSKDVVTLFAGSEYADTSLILKLFSCRVVVLMAECVFAQQILFVYGKEKILVVFGFCFGFFNCALNFLLYHFSYFNAETAILSTALAETLIIVVEYFYIKKKIILNFRIPKDIVKYLGFSILLVPIFFIVKPCFNSSIIQVVITSLCYIVGYVALLLWSEDRIVQESIEKLKFEFLKKI